MGYTLQDFCEDHHALLTSGQPLDRALPQIAEKLSVLLRNPDFVAETFNDDTPIGRRTLHHDPDTDVYVLAHVYEGPKKGSPHNHGASWAVYGTARDVGSVPCRSCSTSPRCGTTRRTAGCMRVSPSPTSARSFPPGINSG